MQLASDLLFALDPCAFAVQRLGFTPDEWQARVLRWSGKRLLLNCSRQSGKSTTTAILGLHRALYQPHALVLLISPSQRQSSELFRKVGEFLKRLDVQPRLVEDNKLSCTFENGARIVSLPSNETTVRGFSAVSLVVEDEAARVSDELHVALSPMLAISNGQLIEMSTPYGKRGHFYSEWETGGDVFERVQVKATECKRISPEFLEHERKIMGDYFFAQEYLCEFRDTIDQIFSTELVEKAVTENVKPLF